jgi:L-lysine 2,3-aminomutase
MQTTESWQNALSRAITDPAELLALLQLDPELLPAAEAASRLFELRVPRGFVDRMKKGDPTDPLLQQVLPLYEELNTAPDFSLDPLQESLGNPLPGLLHKYQGRVLLTLTGSCGVNCRYCFRRNFPYAENNPGSSGLEKIMDYIKNDASIHEVIFSGGEPLVATDKRLQQLIQNLRAIPHVKTLRIHTRMPIVIPERITEEFLNLFEPNALRWVVVIHCNHAQEIDDTVIAALQKLRARGVTLLNQSVLLKNINDNAASLIALSEALFSAGVLPYYLHLLDKAQGTAHFEVSKEKAQALWWEMAKNLPGYLVPKLVYEQGGAPAKLPVCPPF